MSIGASVPGEEEAAPRPVSVLEMDGERVDAAPRGCAGSVERPGTFNVSRLDAAQSYERTSGGAAQCEDAAHPNAFSTSQAERVVPKDCKFRRVKYLDNVIEQDHCSVKKKVRSSQCFKSFHTAERTLEGVEAIKMIRKGQVKRLAGSDARGQVKFVTSLFQIAA